MHMEGFVILGTPQNRRTRIGMTIDIKANQCYKTLSSKMLLLYTANCGTANGLVRTRRYGILKSEGGIRLQVTQSIDTRPKR